MRDYLARRVREALQRCIAQLRKDKEPVDESLLFGEIDAAIREFMKIVGGLVLFFTSHGAQTTRFQKS